LDEILIMLAHEAKCLASHLQGGPRLSPNSTPWQAEKGWDNE